MRDLGDGEMRIRTIKPEFWTHPVMARLPAQTQLLALALLNHADDEGYFMADPALVRGACAPFREPLTSIEQDLATLSETGWIDLCDHPDQGKIGRVRSWDKHQHINRPNASRLKAYFITEHSRSTHGVLHEDSLPEGKGKEQGREQGTGSREARAGEAGEGESERPAPQPELLEAARPVLGLTCEAVLVDMLGTWSADWIRRALSVAVDRGKTGPPYVRGILQRWQREGKPDDDIGAINGRNQPHQKSHRAGGAYTAGAAAKFAGMG